MRKTFLSNANRRAVSPQQQQQLMMMMMMMMNKRLCLSGLLIVLEDEGIFRRQLSH